MEQDGRGAQVKEMVAHGGGLGGWQPAGQDREKVH